MVDAVGKLHDIHACKSLPRLFPCQVINNMWCQAYHNFCFFLWSKFVVTYCL